VKKQRLKAHEKTLVRWWQVALDGGEDRPGWQCIAEWCNGARSYCSDRGDIAALEATEAFRTAERLARERAAMCGAPIGPEARAGMVKKVAQ